MALEWNWLLLIWLILGAISAAMIYLDMKSIGKVEVKWIVICLVLSLIGFILYYVMRGRRPVKKPGQGRELPPKADYGKPEYRFEDVRSEPAKVAEVSQMKFGPEPEPVEKKTKVVSNGPVLVAPPVKESRVEPTPVERPKPKVNQIEGIPRCSDCGAAISKHDIKCPNCDKPLR
jgi:hypothetical protein